MDVIRNVWEVTSDEQALLALAGHSTQEEFERDRAQHTKEIVDYCSITPQSRGFEIGSGEGTVARILAPQCQSLDCNDISASFLERARANCAQHPNVSFHKIESDYLDYLPEQSYDFGFSLHVFIHLNPYDMFNYFLSIKRILKPNGYFYFDACTLGDQTVKVFREHAEMYRRAPERVRGLLSFNHPGMVKAVVQEAGFQVSDRSEFSESGWMKVLTINKSGLPGRGGIWPIRRS